MVAGNSQLHSTTHWFYMKWVSIQKISGNEVYYTAWSLLVILIKSCCKLDCKKSFTLKHISYQIGATSANQFWWRKFLEGLKPSSTSSNLKLRLIGASAEKNPWSERTADALWNFPWSERTADDLSVDRPEWNTLMIRERKSAWRSRQELPHLTPCIN